MCFAMLQVTHKAQYEAKRQVLQENNNVDDIYDMLAIYDQKVPTTDQARAFFHVLMFGIEKERTAATDWYPAHCNHTFQSTSLIKKKTGTIVHTLPSITC